MLEVLGTEYIKFARAKGLSEAVVIWKHGFERPVPVVTFIGFVYGVIIPSGVVVEVVFGWPGVARL